MSILPEEFAALFALGENFYSQGQYKKAQIIFQGLMALDAQNLMACVAYGEALLINGEGAKALAHFTQASLLFPASHKVLVGSAKACILLNRLSDAQNFLLPIINGHVKVTPEISQEISGIISRITK
jgi:Flp pilus assembly protein TadD